MVPPTLQRRCVNRTARIGVVPRRIIRAHRMALQAGQRFGSFEIIGPLGRGGMGEVYRARDTRLQRDVAVKVLSEAHASNPDRIARFRRESVVLASLLHPNIATLFAVEESGPVKMLVMEVVEGVL